MSHCSEKGDICYSSCRPYSISSVKRYLNNYVPLCCLNDISVMIQNLCPLHSNIFYICLCHNFILNVILFLLGLDKDSLLNYTREKKSYGLYFQPIYLNLILHRYSTFILNIVIFLMVRWKAQSLSILRLPHIQRGPF